MCLPWLHIHTHYPRCAGRGWVRWHNGLRRSIHASYLGESVESVMRFLQQVNLEQFSDPFQLEEILAYVDGICPATRLPKRRSILLCDLVGKLLGAPWHKIWGLDKSKAPSTTYTIGIDTPDVVRQKTLEVAGQFNILKGKVGAWQWQRRWLKPFAPVTQLPIAVDANQGWTDKHIMRSIWFSGSRNKALLWLNNLYRKTQLDDIAWVTQQSPLPIFADESLQRLSDVVNWKRCICRNQH